MTITISDEDAAALRDFLRDRSRELERESARTDVKAFRHTLVERAAAVQRLLAQLEPVHA